MGPYLGDYKEDATLDFIWDSNDSNGASITRATNGTISVYKANGATQSVAGVTDTEDFDSLTGIHHVRVDLSSDAFYATGNDYMVVLSAATIDGQTVNTVLALFSIENRWDPFGAVTSDEPAQGAPAATATARTKIDHIYKAYRNKKTQTSSEWSLYDDAGSTVDHKSTVSDDGTTATKGEIATGP